MRHASLIAVTIATAAGLALAACAGAARKNSQATSSSAAPDAADAAGTMEQPSPYGEQVDAIVKWDADITGWRKEMGLSPRPTSTAVMQFRSLPSSRKYCFDDQEPANQICSDVCDLARHICENSEDICRVAGDMPNNSWAAGRCDEAKTSCKEAEEACCGCDGEETASGTTGGDDGPPQRWRY